MRQANIDHHTMPDLSGLYEKSILNVMLDSVVGVDRGPKSYPERGVWINLVRLTDKSVVEYGLARDNVDKWISGWMHGQWSPLFRSVDHFESTIVSAHRSIKMADALRALGYGRSNLAPTDGQRNKLRLLRNHIEHTDEKILQLKIAKNEPFLLVPTETRLQLGPVGISYRDLASCITKLYRTVEHIRGASNL